MTKSSFEQEVEAFFEDYSALWNIYTNLVPKQIAADVAVVMFELEWDIKAAGRTQPMSGTDPGMAVLKRKPEGWRMCAYVEACMHPACLCAQIL